METTIFIKASDEKIHEAFDATETNGYLLYFAPSQTH